MTTYLFRSSDAGAPTLSGTASALIGILDACLKNGYNSKTVTITRSGSTATVTCTSHGFVQWQTVQISGATETEYNGKFLITSAPTSNTFTVTVSGSPSTPATGTITAKVAPMGWTKDYTGTNKAVYRMPTGTPRHYLRVYDADAQYSRVRGFESMSDVDTGTGLFPTTAQVPSEGLYWYKSDAASGAARDWIVFGDDNVFYIFLCQSTGSWAGSYVFMTYFGLPTSFRSGDSYHTMIGGGESSSYANPPNYSPGTFTYDITLTSTSWTIGKYMPRELFQEGSAIPFNQVVSGGIQTVSTNNPVNNVFGSGAIPFPNQADGGLYASRIVIGNYRGARGRLRGVYAPAHFRPYDHATVITGSGDLTGKTLYMVNLALTSTTRGSGGGGILLEISDTWSA